MSTGPDACPVGYACLGCRTPGPICDGSDRCTVTAGRPCAPGCPGTPADANTLTVSVVDTLAGPICVTRCHACTADGRFPRLTPDAVVRLAAEHRDHRESPPET